MFEQEQRQIQFSEWSRSFYNLEDSVQQCRKAERPEGFPSCVLLLADDPRLGDVPESVSKAIRARLSRFAELWLTDVSYDFMFGNQPKYVIDRVLTHIRAK